MFGYPLLPVVLFFLDLLFLFFLPPLGGLVSAVLPGCSTPGFCNLSIFDTLLYFPVLCLKTVSIRLLLSKKPQNCLYPIVPQEEASNLPVGYLTNINCLCNCSVRKSTVMRVQAWPDAKNAKQKSTASCEQWQYAPLTTVRESSHLLPWEGVWTGTGQRMS